MLAAKGCEGPLGFSALSKPAGLFHPGRQGRRSFLLAKLLCLAGPEWLEGKSGLETRIPLLSEPGLVSFLLGPLETCDHPSCCFCAHLHFSKHRISNTRIFGRNGSSQPLSFLETQECQRLESKPAL